MHRFDANVDDLEGFVSELEEKMSELVEGLSDAEFEVYNIIADTITPNPRNKKLVSYPEDFFKQSVDALNKHFGGKGDMAITEKVRKALLATHQWAMADDDYWDDPLVDEAKESEEDK